AVREPMRVEHAAPGRVGPPGDADMEGARRPRFAHQIRSPRRSDRGLRIIPASGVGTPSAAAVRFVRAGWQSCQHEAGGGRPMDGGAAVHLDRVLAAMAGPAARPRPDQQAAVEALVDGRRVLLVQATGWGKSAVYWAATAALRE